MAEQFIINKKCRFWYIQVQVSMQYTCSYTLSINLINKLKQWNT